MHEITGAAMLLTAAGLSLRYRPAGREQKLLLAMTVLMGTMSLTVGGGGPGVETVQTCLSFIVALCFALSLRRGRTRAREKKKPLSGACGEQVRTEEKNCA